MPVETYGSPTTIITGPTTVGPYSSLWGAATPSAFDVINGDTPADIPGLSLTVTAGHLYSFVAVLNVTADLVGGWQVGFTSGVGAATATWFIADIRAEDSNGAGGGATQHLKDSNLSLDTTGGVGTADLVVWIYGTILVNAGGTFGIRFAQDVATPATTSTVEKGSFLWVKDESPGLGGITFAPLTTNTIPKATSAATLGDSLLTDDGTTLAYSGAGGIAGTVALQAAAPGVTQVGNAHLSGDLHAGNSVIADFNVIASEIDAPADNNVDIFATATTAGVTGKNVSLYASNGVAPAAPGAVSGGDIHLNTGAAQRNAAGDANGGSVKISLAAGVGTGLPGRFHIGTAGGMLSYANNAAAVAAGLVAGDVYVVTASDPLQLAIVF